LLRSLFILLVYLAIFGLGLGVPFVLTLGYVWVDMFRPANVVYPFLRTIPYALLIGGAAMASYLMLDRRAPPRIGPVTVLTLALALWVTLTTLWAVAPIAAWEKWDWAFKSVLFSVFIPFVIRSRNQIEAFIQVYVFSVAANVIPYGAKTLIGGGGGYGSQHGLMNANFFLGEGATLATVALMTIPMIVFLMGHSRIIPTNFWTKIGYLGLIVLAVATAIGTHERTPLVGMVVLVAFLWWKSRRKILVGAFCAALAAGSIAFAPASWFERMATITSSETERDDSVNVRLAVWNWTLDYVKVHPQGGGFAAFYINEITVRTDAETGATETQRGRAFHSIYFEVLGEHGYVGIALFLGLFLFSFRALRQVVRLSRNRPDLQWSRDLANALQVSTLVVMACGAFTGFAFQPFVYYLFAMSVSVREYVRRVQEEGPVPVLAPIPASQPLAVR